MEWFCSHLVFSCAFIQIHAAHTRLNEPLGNNIEIHCLVCLGSKNRQLIAGVWQLMDLIKRQPLWDCTVDVASSFALSWESICEKAQFSRGTAGESPKWFQVEQQHPRGRASCLASLHPPLTCRLPERQGMDHKDTLSQAESSSVIRIVPAS